MQHNIKSLIGFTIISPAALKEPDWENESFPVRLTKEQVKNSPDIDTEKSVSRQQEMALYNYYEWPYGDPIGAGCVFKETLFGRTDIEKIF